jgi:hypothetical protein
LISQGKARLKKLPSTSACGTKRTSNCRPAMSAFEGKADIGISERHVRF